MENLSNEIWKDIKDFENLYQVSSLGRVKSLQKEVMNYMGLGIRKEKVLKPRINNSGYEYINLRKFKDPKSFMVHRLVAIAFVENPQNKPQVNHINGIKSDNRLENLEWCTASENVKHSYIKLNRQCFRREKLNKEEVLEIRKMLKLKGNNITNLSLKLNISRTTIWKISKNLSYKENTRL